ncbi:MAG: cell division protein FtsA [Bacteroidales bacterium]|nr:cell division protein FtsA [Bacteroidales bacterium]
MKNKNDFLVGLDIGTTKIAVIVGQLNDFKKLNVLGHAVVESPGVKRGVIHNIDKTVEAIRTAVEIAERQSRTEIHQVNVGIAGQHIRSLHQIQSVIRNNPEEEISQQEINDLIKNMYRLNLNPGEEIIHVIPEEYIVNGEHDIKDPVGMIGSSMDVKFHIITGSMSAIANIQKSVNKAGLHINDLILEPLASSYAVLSEEEKEAGVALIDIGGGTTDLAIFVDGILVHSAVIPFGGDIITEDIKVGLSILRNHAEALKIKFGNALPDEVKDDVYISIPGLKGRSPKEISMKNLSLIIHARTEEILEFIYNEIKNAGFHRKLIAGIVLTGGGSQLKNIAQLCQFVTGMETRIGYPTEHLGNSVSKELHQPMYSTSIGLILHEVYMEENVSVNENTPNQGGREVKGFFRKLIQKSSKFFEDDIE